MTDDMVEESSLEERTADWFDQSLIYGLTDQYKFPKETNQTCSCAPLELLGALLLLFRNPLAISGSCTQLN